MISGTDLRCSNHVCTLVPLLRMSLDQRFWTSPAYAGQSDMRCQPTSRCHPGSQRIERFVGITPDYALSKSPQMAPWHSLSVGLPADLSLFVVHGDLYAPVPRGPLAKHAFQAGICCQIAPATVQFFVLLGRGPRLWFPQRASRGSLAEARGVLAQR